MKRRIYRGRAWLRVGQRDIPAWTARADAWRRARVPRVSARLDAGRGRVLIGRKTERVTARKDIGKTRYSPPQRYLARREEIGRRWPRAPTPRRSSVYRAERHPVSRIQARPEGKKVYVKKVYWPRCLASPWTPFWQQAGGARAVRLDVTPATCCARRGACYDSRRRRSPMSSSTHWEHNPYNPSVRDTRAKRSRATRLARLAFATVRPKHAAPRELRRERPSQKERERDRDRATLGRSMVGGAVTSLRDALLRVTRSSRRESSRGDGVIEANDKPAVLRHRRELPFTRYSTFARPSPGAYPAAADFPSSPPSCRNCRACDVDRVHRVRPPPLAQHVYLALLPSRPPSFKRATSRRRSERPVSFTP